MNRIGMKLLFVGLLTSAEAHAQISARPAAIQHSPTTPAVAASIKKSQGCPYPVDVHMAADGFLEPYDKTGGDKGPFGCRLTASPQAVQQPVFTLFQRFQHGEIATSPTATSQGELPTAKGGNFVMQEIVAAYQTGPQRMVVSWMPSMGDAPPSAGEGPDRFEVHAWRGTNSWIQDFKGPNLPYTGAMDVYQGQVEFNRLQPGIYAVSARGCVKDECQDWAQQMVLYVNVDVPPVIAPLVSRSVGPRSVDARSTSNQHH